MGVEGKKNVLFRTLMMQVRNVNRPVSMTTDEWLRVDRMVLWVSNAVAQAIEQHSYVTQRELEYTIARVVAMVLKLNYDMFGEVGGEADHMAVLIRRAWKEIKDVHIDY